MGLDMYLNGYPKLPGCTLEQVLEVEEKIDDYIDLAKASPTTAIPVYETAKSYIRKMEYGNWHTIANRVGYWRKANAIHGWFIRHVQDGVDECDPYEVSAEDIGILLDICKAVLRNKGNAEFAHRYLPTVSGFFFGSTDYGQDYYADVEETIDILANVLDTFDFENNYLVYRSSW